METSKGWRNDEYGQELRVGSLYPCFGLVAGGGWTVNAAGLRELVISCSKTVREVGKILDEETTRCKPETIGFQRALAGSARGS